MKKLLLILMVMVSLIACSGITMAAGNNVFAVDLNDNQTIGWQYYVNDNWSIDSQFYLYSTEHEDKEIQYSRDSDEYAIGIGASYHWNMNKIKPYVGAMVYRCYRKENENDSGENYCYKNDDDWKYALNFGVEYPISEQFSLIGQSGLYWRKYDNKRSASSSIHQETSGTASVIKLAYRF